MFSTILMKNWGAEKSNSGFRITPSCGADTGCFTLSSHNNSKSHSETLTKFTRITSMPSKRQM